MSLRLLNIKISMGIGHNAEMPKEVLEWLTNLLTVAIFKDLSGLVLTGIASENPWNVSGVRMLQKQARKGSDKTVFAVDEIVGNENIWAKLIVADHPGSAGSDKINNYVATQSKSFTDEYRKRHPKYLTCDCVTQIQGIPGFEDQDVKEFIDSLRAYLRSHGGLEMTGMDLFQLRLDRGLELSLESLIKDWLVERGEIQKVDPDRYRFP